MRDFEAVPLLINLLGDSSLTLRWAAAAGLGAFHDPRITGLLLPLLENGPMPLREAAIQALGENGDPGALEPLLGVLTKGVPALRWPAAQALGRLGDLRALEPLLDELKRGEWKMGDPIARLLDAISSQAYLDLLLDCLTVKGKTVRQAAARALIRLYRSGDIPEAERQRILQSRQRMLVSHSDYESGCGEFVHADSGIGVDFLL